MGNLNAKLNSDNVVLGNVIGKHNLGDRKDNCDRFLGFAHFSNTELAIKSFRATDTVLVMRSTTSRSVAEVGVFSWMCATREMLISASKGVTT